MSEQAPRRRSTGIRSAQSSAGSVSRRSVQTAGARASQQPRPAARRRRKNTKPKRKLWVRLLAWSGLSFLGLLVAGLATFILAYVMIDIPKPDQVALAQGTTVYYADGTTVMGTFATVDRKIIDTKTLPDYVGKLVVASEDRRFYENPGIDIRGIIRAMVNNLTGGPRQGASTLTQQYVERYYLGETTGYIGKAKEAILALKINRSQSKDEILSNYLNTIYFGRGSYGIDAAARAYFNKGAAQLSVSEAALLAGIIPAPNAYDPRNGPKMALARYQRVLKIATEDKYISAGDADPNVLPETVEPRSRQVYAGSQGYLLQHVRQELAAKAGMTEEQIDTSGLQIVTTIDKTKQDQAVAAVASLPADRPANLRVGLVSLDTGTGAILVEYGGADYLQVQASAVTYDIAQAGSTFKPFTLIAGLQAGKTLETRYSGATPMKFGADTVNNFERQNFGIIDLTTATAYSVNTSYMQLNKDIGAEKTKEAAIRAGIPADAVGLGDNLGNVLGTSSPHLIDIATAYNTLANQGKTRVTHIVSEVKNSAGDLIYRADTSSKQVFKSDIMADVTYALTQVVQRGSGKNARALGRPVAAKTGTSENNRSALFVGYIPQMVTAVSMYQVGQGGAEEQITPFGGFRQITGSTWPARLWTAFMKEAVSGLPVEKFPPRSRPIPVEIPSEEPSEEPSETPTEKSSPQPNVPTTQPTITISPTPHPTTAPTSEPTTPGTVVTPPPPSPVPTGTGPGDVAPAPLPTVSTNNREAETNNGAGGH